jgi:DNA-directed RNA polymerase subunit RPC12/RpoP
MPIHLSTCTCGWKVPKNVILYSDENDVADIEYECPECGQKHVIGVFDHKKAPTSKN